MSDTKMLPVDPATISGLKTVLDNAPYIRGDYGLAMMQ